MLYARSNPGNKSKHDENVSEELLKQDEGMGELFKGIRGWEVPMPVRPEGILDAPIEESDEDGASNAG